MFTGVSSLANGSPSDTSIDVNFTALAREGTADAGASTGTTAYYAYLTSTAAGGSPTDPCTTGTVWGAGGISATPYAPGVRTLTLTGLTPRMVYRVCLRAQDASGNMSIISNSVSITRLDVTAPVFDGIQSLTYSAGTGNLVLA